MVGDVTPESSHQDYRFAAVLPSGEIGGGRGLVGYRDPRGPQLSPSGVALPTPILEWREAGAADRNLALSVAPGPAKGVADHDRRRYAGQLVRRTREFTRDVIVPPELRGTDREIFVYRVGDQARRLGTAHDDPLRYAPWGAGIYWILACDATECFVIAATRQSS